MSGAGLLLLARTCCVMATVVVLAACTASSRNGTQGERAPASTLEAAEIVCPVMWDWVTAVGDAFNGASRDVADISSPDGRRARWTQAFDEIEDLDAALLEQVDPYKDDQILAPVVAEIVAGMEISRAELADLRDLLASSPEVDEGRHQDRTAQLVIRVEKLIDVVKPEMAGLDPTGSLIPTFRMVPSCQHALKDVDDGVPRDNG